MKQPCMLVAALAVASAASFVSGGASAQSNISIYGVADAGVAYASNQNGNANTYLRSGSLSASKIGFEGAEALGGDLRALFLLESGFELDSGAQSASGALFNRQAYVGLQSRAYGAVTAGRQYTPYYLLVGSLASSNVLTGATGAHPGDIDGLDTTVRVNNALTYSSPVWRGVQGSAQYGFGEAAGGNAAGSSFSAAVKYSASPAEFALGYLRLRNGRDGTGWSANASGSFGISAINRGYASAESIQFIAASARYTMGKWMVGANASNVQYQAGSRSAFRDTAIFNTAGVISSYQLTPQWFLSAGYSDTRATSANGVSDRARYRQLSFEQHYALSKRTAIYLIEARQLAHGQTLGEGVGIVDAVASVGDSQNGTPSSNGRQTVLLVGLKHAF
ncbi:porin [Janthinobacterium sp.]|jgi:predicted porin|uniref:porin n=1 Tax=Janthinobacterium sp. TaxID=1871054 RepID=UPI002632DDDF|nr:porin [Janthinobacterium sp.]